MRILVLVLVLMGSVCYAGDVTETFINMDGKSINGTTVCTAAAGAADQNSISVPINQGEAHALAYKYTAANAGSSFTLSIQCLLFGTDWEAPDTAITVTCAGASGAGIVPISLPVCSEIRVVRSSDATYATTLTACTINRARIAR
jgi:hypothetical protein